MFFVKRMKVELIPGSEVFWWRTWDGKLFALKEDAVNHAAAMIEELVEAAEPMME